MKILTEDRSLQRGIFWVKDIDDISKSFIYFSVPCNNTGENLIDPEEYNASKDGLSHNHENTWNNLSHKVTEGKPFNYFPRGRVEIHNGIADIYCSLWIYGEELKETVIDKFNLYKANGIKKINLKADNSEHYQCYLDK